MAKIYSPTATQEYRRCPRKWALGHQGWRSSFIGYPDIAMSTGTGIHRVAELAHTLVIKFPDNGRDMLTEPTIAKGFIEGGIEAATSEVRRRLELGGRPLDKLEDWENRISDNVKRGGLAYLEAFNRIFPRDWIINEAELSFGADERSEEGYEGCADILITDDFGLAIVDIKTKTAFKTEFYRELFVDQFQHSWQMLQYCWLTKRHYGELPKRFYLLMVEMKTRPQVTLHSYRLDLEYLAYWEHTVTKLWAEMERIEEGLEVPGVAPEHVFFGRKCPFYSACFSHGLNEDTMRGEYINIKGVGDES